MADAFIDDDAPAVMATPGPRSGADNSYANAILVVRPLDPRYRTLQYLGPEGCPELAPELLRTAVISSILFQMTQ